MAKKAVQTNAENFGYFNPPNVYRPEIIDIELVGEWNPEDGAINTYRITQNDGKIFDFFVKNGSGGSTGRGIVSIEEIETSVVSSGVNIIRVTFTDGTTSDFQVRNGAKGGKGDTGARGPVGVEEVNAEIGTNDPTQAPSVVKTFIDGVLSFVFNNIKGEKGDKGDQGNTGSSVEYPFELVNGLEETTTGKALDAVQGKVLDGKITELNQDVNGAEDTPYNPDAQWEFYLQNGAPTGWRGVSTNSYPMVADTRINKIIFPAIRVLAASTIQYYICYGDFPESSSSINPSNTTPIKSGTIEIETANQWLDNYTVNLDSEVVIPTGKKVYIFMYRYGGSCFFNGGGVDFNETEPYYDVTDAFAYFITTNEEAPFEQNWSKASPNDTMRYRVCAPKLYLIIDGIEKEIKDDIIEELESSDLIPTIVEETISNDEKVEVHLPDKLYAVVGDKLQIFYQGCIKADNLDCYDIEIACAKGKQLTRYYEYAPAASDVGSVSFTLYVKSNKENKILGQKTCTLITSAAPSSPQALKHVFCFGDSLTAGGYWPAEMKRRLVAVSTYDLIQGSGLSNIEFYGYMDRTVNGQNAHYYGVGGWTWKQYITKSTGGAFRFYVSGINQLSVDAVYSNNGHEYTIQEINVTGGDGNIRCLTSSNANIPSASGVLTKVSGEGDDTITFTSYEVENQNPLWDDANNKMSFIPYAQDCGASTIDAVYVLLTWNGMHPNEVFSVDDVTGHIADAKTFARTLHTEYPSAKLVIMGLQMPSITGGLGYNYGANGGYADKFGMKITALNYNKALQDLCNLDEFSPYCQFIGIASQFDTLYNMPFNTVRVNARNGDITEPVGSNGVHPAKPGYMQIADACYRHFVSEYCQ